MSYDNWRADGPEIKFENLGEGAMRARSHCFQEDVHIPPSHRITIEPGPGKQVVIRKEKRRPVVTRSDVEIILVNSDPDDLAGTVDSLMKLIGG